MEEELCVKLGCLLDPQDRGVIAVQLAPDQAAGLAAGLAALLAAKYCKKKKRKKKLC